MPTRTHKHTQTHSHTYVYIYMYVCIQLERERERRKIGAVTSCHSEANADVSLVRCFLAHGWHGQVRARHAAVDKLHRQQKHFSVARLHWHDGELLPRHGICIFARWNLYRHAHVLSLGTLTLNPKPSTLDPRGSRLLVPDQKPADEAWAPGTKQIGKL